MVVVGMMETSSANGEDANSAASANVPVVAESSSTSSRSSWPYDGSSVVNLQNQPASPSTISSLAASEAAAAAAAIDIDNYFRGSNGFFTPMQNTYNPGKTLIFRSIRW